MAERLEFREKLAGILALCASQNNITDKTTVEEYFAEDNLSKEQMELVFDYLLSQKVIVKGYVKAFLQKMQPSHPVLLLSPDNAPPHQIPAVPASQAVLFWNCGNPHFLHVPG